MLEDSRDYAHTYLPDEAWSYRDEHGEDVAFTVTRVRQANTDQEVRDVVAYASGGSPILRKDKFEQWRPIEGAHYRVHAVHDDGGGLVGDYPDGLELRETPDGYINHAGDKMKVIAMALEAYEQGLKHAQGHELFDAEVKEQLARRFFSEGGRDALREAGEFRDDRDE